MRAEQAVPGSAAVQAARDVRAKGRKNIFMLFCSGFEGSRL